CIAIRRSLGPVTAARIEDLIHRSILYADAYPDAGMEYIRKHAKELDDEVINQHICLYVNQFSKELGAIGEAAIHLFFEKAVKAGLMTGSSSPLFAAPESGRLS
ncbi:MAG: MqnA/MqnD/SBP family protein, partial [Pseudomonadota bacterium]